MHFKYKIKFSNIYHYINYITYTNIGDYNEWKYY